MVRVNLFRCKKSSDLTSLLSPVVDITVGLPLAAGSEVTIKAKVPDDADISVACLGYVDEQNSRWICQVADSEYDLIIY